MEKREVTVAVLDTGVSDLFANYVYESYEVFQKDTDVCSVEKKYSKDNFGHGTSIVYIIKNIEEQLKIINFKICNQNDEISDMVLCRALEYIDEQLDVNIINISAGTINACNVLKMQKICQRLKNKGVVIFSAFENEGNISYPAALECVVGVDISDELKNNEVVLVKKSVVNIVLPKKYYRSYWADGRKVILQGTSYACAYLSGLYGKHLLEGKNIEMFLDSISTMEYECKTYKEIEKPRFDIKHAIIFPVNKEAHALLRFRDQVSFEIDGAYDDRVSGNVGKKFGEIKVQKFDDIDWNAEFDTFILSCVKDLESLVKKDYFLCIKEKCDKYGKKLYCFEDYNEKISDNCNVFYPKVGKVNIPSNKLGKLNRVSIPVVAVFGTSSKQGKYTLQLEIIKHLKLKGYDVGFLATEPSGYLFSADYTFHFGFHSNLNLGLRDIITILNDAIHNIELKGKEIVITGCQSAITHYDICNISQFCVEQYGFLLGVSPDFSVLCVNAYDEIEYIKRSIACIYSAGQGSVEAIALYPITVQKSGIGLKYGTRFLDDDEIEKIKENLNKSLSLPVYCIGLYNDMVKLCERIIEYFSEEEVI